MLPPAVREPPAGDDEPRRRRPRSCAASSRRSSARPRSSRRWPRRRPSCSRTSTPRSRRSPAWRARRSRRRSRASPAADGRRDPRLPAAAPVPEQHRRLRARAAPRRRRAARDAARPGRRARARHAGAAPLAGVQPRRWSACSRTLERLRDRPDRERSASTACATRSASLRPTLALPHAGPDHLQLRDALVPQHREPAVRGRPERHLAALHHHHDAAGPELRERPVERARPTARRSTTTCTRTRTRTPRRPGQTKECEAGNEDYLVGPPGASATCPGNQGTRRPPAQVEEAEDAE